MFGTRLLNALSDRVRAWLAAKAPAAAHPQPNAPPAVVAASGALQTDVVQWSKISSVLLGGAGAADRARQLQIAAGQQLDAASYALDILKSELTAAMQLTPPQAVSATVVPLKRPLRPKRQKQSKAA